MRDSRRIQERLEVRVDRARVVWLTLGFVVSLGLSFALGFIVGRRAERIEPSPSKVDVLTQIESDKAMHEELTFYAKLTEGEASSRQPVPGAGDPAAPESAPTVPNPRAQPPSSEQTRPSNSDQATRPGTRRAAVVQRSPSTDREAKLEKAVARALAEANQVDSQKVSRALASGPAQPGDYTVQVSAFQSLGEAKAYSAGLERKGYRPFVVTSTIRGRGTWYRVRLGKFESEREAEEAKMILAQAAIPAWVLQVE